MGTHERAAEALTVVLTRGLVALALLGTSVVTGCAARQMVAAPVQAATLGWQPDEEDYAERTLSKGDAPFDLEIVSTVMPPGINAACPGGKAFVSFSGTSVMAPFECLDDPGTSRCKAAGGVVSSPFASQGSMPLYAPDEHSEALVCLPTEKTQSRYVVAGTDTDSVRTPTSIVQLKAYYDRDTGTFSETCDVRDHHAVNFVRRSTDCGNTWTYSHAIDAGPLHDGDVSGNADFPFLYFDRFTQHLFLLAHTGPYMGGVNTALVWRSVDDGRTWSPLPGSRLPPNLQSLTSVGDAESHALVAFGCGPNGYGVNNGVIQVFVSYDDAVSWERVPDKTFSRVPRCGVLAASASPDVKTYMPGHAGSFVGPVTNALAYRTSPTRDSFEVRLAYSWLEPDSTRKRDHLRQTLQYGVLAFPRKSGGLDRARFRGARVVGPDGPDDSIFRATFTQPWVEGATSSAVQADSAILWWIEASPRDGTHASSFLGVSGDGDFSDVQPLSATRTGQHRWRPNLNCRGIDGEGGVGVDAQGRLVDKQGVPTPGTWWCFAGDYDRGTAWIDSAGRMRFFHTWSESHDRVAQPNYFLHYNQVILTP